MNKSLQGIFWLLVFATLMPASSYANLWTAHGKNRDSSAETPLSNLLLRGGRSVNGNETDDSDEMERVRADCETFDSCVEGSTKMAVIWRLAQFRFEELASGLPGWCGETTTDCDMGLCDNVPMYHLARNADHFFDLLCFNTDGFVAGRSCWASVSFRSGLEACVHTHHDSTSDGRRPTTVQTLLPMVMCFAEATFGIEACGELDASLVALTMNALGHFTMVMEESH